MKKKIAFFTKNLDIGGIERAIINYVNNIPKDKYEVTLFLEKKEGIYLNEIDNDIKIIDFNISENKIIIVRKLINLFKLLIFSIKYHNKFDFAANFATYLKSGAILSKRFSKNNAIWYHGNYWENVDEANKFIKYTRTLKYKKIVFVSNSLKEKYLKYFPNTNQKIYILNNMINYEEMIEKSKIDLGLKHEKTTILNVGRHEESSKKLTLLINTTRKLIDEGYDFNLWLVGDGIDHQKYIDMIKELNLNKYVTFYGKQNNVYPYYKKCDAVILTSVAEGNPVVFLEAKVLNKPVITTDVSDAKTEIKGYGIINEFSSDGVYKGLKQFLDNGYTIKKKFNYKEYNIDKLNKLLDLIEK